MHFVGYMLGVELLAWKSICRFNFVDSLVDTSSFPQNVLNRFSLLPVASLPRVGASHLFYFYFYLGLAILLQSCHIAVLIGMVLVTKEVEFRVLVGLSNILFQEIPIHIIHLFFPLGFLTFSY